MNSENNIFFSVVIPTFERPADLRNCLNSLSTDVQASAPNYEIIVTDDSISENSKNLVKNEFPQVQWGNGKKIGPAGNRNAGVERAKENGLFL